MNTFPPIDGPDMVSAHLDYLKKKIEAEEREEMAKMTKQDYSQFAQNPLLPGVCHDEFMIGIDNGKYVCPENQQKRQKKLLLLT